MSLGNQLCDWLNGNKKSLTKVGGERELASMFVLFSKGSILSAPNTTGAQLFLDVFTSSSKVIQKVNFRWWKTQDWCWWPKWREKPSFLCGLKSKLPLKVLLVGQLCGHAHPFEVTLIKASPKNMKVCPWLTGWSSLPIGHFLKRIHANSPQLCPWEAFTMRHGLS